jgi:maltose alpha-D-glucosyltransferase/alpha-amylase
MRKEVPEIGWGDFRVIAMRDPAILAIRYDWRNNSLLFVHNLDQKPREASFSVGLSDDEGEHLISLLWEDHSEANDLGKHTLMLEAYGYGWYRVGGLDYLLKRTDIDGVNVSSPAALFLIARCSPRRHPDKPISRA